MDEVGPFLDEKVASQLTALYQNKPYDAELESLERGPSPIMVGLSLPRIVYYSFFIFFLFDILHMCVCFFVWT
jgi:hypothetical protein